MRNFNTVPAEAIIDDLRQQLSDAHYTIAVLRTQKNLMENELRHQASLSSSSIGDEDVSAVELRGA